MTIFAMTFFASISLLLLTLIASSTSASLPSLDSFSATTSTSFVGDGGEIILACDYKGELSRRTSGALKWFHESEKTAKAFLTVYHPDISTRLVIDEAFKERVVFAPSQEYGRGAIKITNFKDSMVGRFKCEVYEADVMAFVTEAAHDLKLASLENELLERGDSPIKVREDEPVSFRCSVDAVPKPEVTWWIHGDRVTSGVGFEGVESEDEDEKKKYVSVYEFTPNRSQQGVEIKCIVNGPAVSTVPSRRLQWPHGIKIAAQLEVQYPPDTPYITLEDSQWFYEETILGLGCTVADRGYPPASIKMTFPNQVFVETRTDSVVYKSFRLKSNHHKEKVVCEADSNVEEMKRTATKTLKVAYGPEKVVIKGEVNVVAKQTVTFACVAKNVNPEADIRWFGIDETMNVLNVTQLIVTPTWRQNGAEITCRGSNPYYQDEERDKTASVVLNVKHEPVWNQSDKRQVVKPAGEDALLTCSVMANPSDDLDFEWKFKDEIMAGEKSGEIKVKANASTFGDYTCIAKNAIGDSSFVISLVDPENVAEGATPFTIALIVAIAVGVVLFVVVVFAACRWRSKNKWKKVEADFRRRPIPQIHDESMFLDYRFQNKSPAAAAAAIAVTRDDDTPPNNAAAAAASTGERKARKNVDTMTPLVHDNNDDNDDDVNNDENWNVAKPAALMMLSKNLSRSEEEELIALSRMREEEQKELYVTVS